MTVKEFIKILKVYDPYSEIEFEIENSIPGDWGILNKDGKVTILVSKLEEK